MQRLPLNWIVATAVFSTGLVIVAALGAGALWRSSALAEDMVREQIETLRHTERTEDLLVERGYLSSFLATGDEAWLRKLQANEQAIRDWLDQVAAVAPRGLFDSVRRLRDGYSTYGRTRDAAVEAHRAGRLDDAQRALAETNLYMDRVLAIVREIAEASRLELRRKLDESRDVADRAQIRIAVLAGALALLGVGLGAWTTRRIARPIYELILRVENADTGRLRLESTRGAGSAMPEELATLSGHVERLLTRLSEQQRRLRQAEKMQAVGEIAAKLAHEILNPVAAVKAALQAMARTGGVAEPNRAVLGESDRTLTRVSTTLRRLVQYSRPLEARRQNVDVRQVVQAAVSASSHELSARGLRAEADVPALPAASLDPDLVAQVLTNLVVNAAQAGPEDGRVLVRARKGPHALVLEVADRGAGLPAAREKLFQPFFTTREKGNGLGLAVSANIVAEHGGTIEARDNEGGRGAVFTVTLPQEDDTWAIPS